MHTLADAEQVVLVAAGHPEQLQLFLDHGLFGDQLETAASCSQRRGEPAHPGEGVEMAQPEAEGLAAAHRQARDGPVLAVRLHRVARLDGGDHVLQ